MFIAMVNISMRAIKFEDITVTFQLKSPSKPIIIETEKKQLKSGKNTQRKLLKINQRVKTIKANTPAPNTIISFFINVIISSAIIGIPPRCILAVSLYCFMMFLISFIF